VVRPASGRTPDIAHAPRQAAAEWETLPLPHGLIISVEAQSPRSPLSALGVVQVRIVRSDSPTGTSRVVPFMDLSDLAARAGKHDATEVEVKGIGKLKDRSVVLINIATRSGEDIRDCFVQSTLWSIQETRDGLSISSLWSGFGGESHMAFESCLFGVAVDFTVASDGDISRTCHPFLSKGSRANDFAACPRAEPAGCAETVVVVANAVSRK
jgi:hypothetical protein